MDEHQESTVDDRRVLAGRLTEFLAACARTIQDCHSDTVDLDALDGVVDKWDREHYVAAVWLVAWTYRRAGACGHQLTATIPVIVRELMGVVVE